MLVVFKMLQEYCTQQYTQLAMNPFVSTDSSHPPPPPHRGGAGEGGGGEGPVEEGGEAKGR